MIYGNTVGGSGGGGFGRTFIIQDAAGNQLVGVVTDKPVVFDATPNDIRQGKVAATMEGVTTGEKVILSYNTREGYKIVPAGSEFAVSLPDLDGYDFTKFQAIICPVSGSIAQSVAAEAVVIGDGVYAVQSSERAATVTKNGDTKSVNLGITNTSENIYLLRYFTYKEMLDMDARTVNYAYNYAEIDPETNMCIGVQSCSMEISPDELPENWVEIPVNDPEYCLKYYINGNWYEDAAGTIPWESELL